MIYNLITALQRQLQRSDITLICENDMFRSIAASQSVTVSKLRCSLEGYRVDHLTFERGGGVGDLL